MNMNILIIEIEKHNADRLMRLLSSYEDNIIIYGPLTSVVEVRDFFNSNTLMPKL